MEKKKAKIKTQNIIIFINVIVLLIITFIYTCRLIHYYKIEHPKIDKQLSLAETITLKKNITSVGDGLYKEDDSYFFKGKHVNNYLEYSGILFRIVSVKDNNVKLISDESLTNLVWGIEDDFEKSYINTWLNGKKKHEGVFYSSLNNSDDYLVDTNFCVEKLDENSKKCTDEINTKVGLLSLIEYNLAGGTKSYLNQNNFWWLSNPSKDGVWYVYSDGKINDIINTGNNYYSYGVRPVINIKGNIKLISGDGTEKNPYKFEHEKGNILKDKNVGEFIQYSDLNWRIIERNNDYIRVALDGLIKDKNENYERIYSNGYNVFSKYSDIGYYLNNYFYNTLDNTYLVDGNIYTNRYDSTVDFDYLRIFDNYITAKVGMMQIGDLFINDYDDYFLVSRTSTYTGTVYKVAENNKLYADLPSNKSQIRPTIFLDLDTPIKSGTGSQKDPYVIG